MDKLPDAIPGTHSLALQAPTVSVGTQVTNYDSQIQQREDRWRSVIPLHTTRGRHDITSEEL